MNIWKQWVKIKQKNGLWKQPIFYDIDREFLTKTGFYFGYHKEDKTLHHYDSNVWIVIQNWKNVPAYQKDEDIIYQNILETK